MSEPWTPHEIRYMARALDLSRLGYTTPNPMVGCVIVKNGTIIGEGYHKKSGGPHAEIEALNCLTQPCKGATVYVTLEPCCHYGKTPPCTKALISSGISRVVIAAQDPNPTVMGRGIEELKSANIEVVVGCLEAEARRVNEAFIHYQTTRSPFVTLKYAMTLDGKINTRTGHSKWITGPVARNYVHDLRARTGAILCGIGTILADDSELTARPVTEFARQPVRVVIDPDLKIPLTAKVIRSISISPVIVFCPEEVDKGKLDALAKAGVVVRTLPMINSERICLEALLKHLADLEITSLLVEGGSRTHGAFVEQSCFQRVIAFLAPKLVGGEGALSPIGGIGAEEMDSAIGLTDIEVSSLGQDIMITGLTRFNKQVNKSML